MHSDNTTTTELAVCSIEIPSNKTDYQDKFVEILKFFDNEEKRVPLKCGEIHCPLVGLFFRPPAIQNWYEMEEEKLADDPVTTMTRVTEEARSMTTAVRSTTTCNSQSTSGLFPPSTTPAWRSATVTALAAQRSI